MLPLVLRMALIKPPFQSLAFLIHLLVSMTITIQDIMELLMMIKVILMRASNQIMVLTSIIFPAIILIVLDLSVLTGNSNPIHHQDIFSNRLPHGAQHMEEMLQITWFLKQGILNPQLAQTVQQSPMVLTLQKQTMAFQQKICIRL
nr:hypothetical protein Iba_chr06fCG2620 [Ipomoea batatas]